MKIAIKDIFIPPDRQRKSVNESKIAELAVSIQSHGLLHSLTVAPLDTVRFPDAPSHLPYQLVAGYRRLLAHAFMKIPEVEANFREQLTDLEREEIELDENLVREELSWQDSVAAKARIAQLRGMIYGDGVREVAEHLGEAKSVTADDIKLAKAMEILPELKGSKNKHQAMNKLRMIENRARLHDLSEIHSKMVREVNTGRVGDVSTRVHLGDALEIVTRWNSGIAGCVVTDPPYGINLDEGATKRDSYHPTIYHDDTYDIMDLTSRIATEAFRLLKEDAHAYFFFDIKAYAKVYKMLSDAGFKVDPMPLLWVKPGPGQANHPESRWASGYEACFFCRKGNRQLLKQGQSNVLPHDPVPPGRKIHPVEKPVSLLRQLIESSTVPGEVVVDFFGGSGSTGEAAIQTGRNFLICEKDAAYHAGIIERLNKLIQSPTSEGDKPDGSGDEPASRFDPLGGDEAEGE
jgi:site-specific DNA-methyltransferase (adenine-specific)